MLTFKKPAKLKKVEKKKVGKKESKKRGKTKLNRRVVIMFLGQ